MADEIARTGTTMVHFVPSMLSVFLEVEGAGDYLPKYAGNLDIMTCAALEMAERISEHLDKQGGEQ